MRAVDIIAKKRDKKELNREEIRFFVAGITDGTIPDYQISAWAMAVLLNGMTDQETTELTLAMAESGEVLDLSEISPIVVDKHSTGGVGDKVTLAVGPIVAACGLPVGKMSGRGLGFSGGTIDKLESIPGYRVNLSKEEFLNQLKRIGFVLTGQSTDLAPADGKLYAIRDVTATVPSLPLIASSIMSKKIAAGAHAIVLDVKVGTGAFMKNLEDARKLARLMVAIGKLSGRQVIAVISDMNQPLGVAVGNAIELKEALSTLNGEGPLDFVEHCMLIASYMLLLGKKADTLEAARKLAEEALSSGKAFNKFVELVEAQGGNVNYVKHPEKFPSAPYRQEILADREGYLAEVNAEIVGETAVVLGAGREKKEDVIDPRVGIFVHVKVGDRVFKGEKLFTVLAKNADDFAQAKSSLLEALSWSKQEISPLPLFYDVIQ